MRAVLSSPISVSRLAVFAELAWLERRPELGLLCRAARKQGNRVSVATVQSALPGLPDAGAANVLSWCRMLGLCDAGGALTSLGEDVAERDEAPVPEQGVYDLWLAEHPVIGRRVLAADRLASSQDQRFDAITALPLEPDAGRVFRSVVDPKERFLVRGLPTNQGQRGCILRETHATCHLRWTLDFSAERDQWQLEGLIEVRQGQGKYALRPMQHEPEREGLDLWGLVSTWSVGPLSAFGRWQQGERRLAIPFRGLSDGEAQSFCRTLKLPRVEIPGKGSYVDVTLEDVPVGPATVEDAQQWAMSRFERHLTERPGYRSRAEVRSLFVELTEGTPLERHAPALPPHDEVLGSRVGDPLKNPDRFWSLAAPVDLAPHEVNGAELAALRIGSSAAAPHERATPSSAAVVIRIPYRGGWSMRRLVDCLLSGASPKRVLLCDRYVRGPENLATLNLFVRALRAGAPSAVVDVWTGEEEADFRQIQALTGAAPRSYRDVFGRSLPHDRYVVVQPTSGLGFGWHLTNSPLHARPDVADAGPDSPLRWRDLAGARVSGDELEPALRQWLGASLR